MKYDFNSRLKDIYANPLGHDIIFRLLLQTGISSSYINNPFVKNLKVKTLVLLLKSIDKEFIQAFLDLLNRNNEQSVKDSSTVKKAWWKEAVFYQVYPLTFNGGTLKGITEKLDYLQNLGVDALWLSPIYDSPNDDNGYDIRDYQKIMKSMGTMKDFDKLLSEAHRRGLKLIIDLVVNHTSDEHKWFKQAIKNKTNKYHDYYIFRDKKNNWTSFFRGPAWNYYENINQYAMHLYSKKQMDLNWDNPDLRKEVINMIKWWLEKGVDGFRMDTINTISKMDGLPDGNEKIGNLIGFTGMEHYFYGPHLHEYLKQVRKEAFEPYKAFCVGETPGIGLELSKLLTNESRKELDMIFSFDHLETPGHKRYDNYEYDLNFLKKYYIDCIENGGKGNRLTLFFENHDNPRMPSKVSKDCTYSRYISKLLAAMQLTLVGTPFIYQGQELGETNKKFKSIKDIKDVEGINLYNELLKTKTPKEAFDVILCGTRDHARQPINWKDAEKNEVHEFFVKLIRLRKKSRVFVYGDFRAVHKKSKNLFTYYRSNENEKFYIECNLCNKIISRPNSHEKRSLILSNYEQIDKQLRPYEANIYKVQ